MWHVAGPLNPVTGRLDDVLRHLDDVLVRSDGIVRYFRWRCSAFTIELMRTMP